MAGSGGERMTFRWPAVLGAAALALAGGVARAGDAPDAAQASARDGSADFNFEFGHWRTVVERLRRPLSGSTEWVRYEGTSVVHPFLDGRANLVELSIKGPAG